jgi:cation diffusion facilitator family transporter
MAESLIAVYAALAGNVAVAGTKLAVASFTGSSAMFSEGLHSIVDTGNELFLIWGRHRSRRPPDENHPFGHGQELYFWTLIVSLMIFTAGGVASVYEGILRLQHPEPPHISHWNYIVLGAAAVFETISFSVGIHQFRKAYPGQSYLEVLKGSKDPTLFTVLLEDFTDLIGLGIALVGIALAQLFRTSIWDGAASVAIGILLMATAVVLIRESRGLLTGESAVPAMRKRIIALLRSDAVVLDVRCPLTIHFGPDSVLVAVEIQFRSGLNSSQIVAAIDRLERLVQGEFPSVKRMFIEADSLRAAAK